MRVIDVGCYRRVARVLKLRGEIQPYQKNESEYEYEYRRGNRIAHEASLVVVYLNLPILNFVFLPPLTGIGRSPMPLICCFPERIFRGTTPLILKNPAVREGV
jgi:hypothetical protein